MNILTILLTDIVRKHLFIEILVTRNSDSVDFHNIPIWGIDTYPARVSTPPCEGRLEKV